MSNNIKGIVAFLLALGAVFFFATGRWVIGVVLAAGAFFFIPDNWTPRK